MEEGTLSLRQIGGGLCGGFNPYNSSRTHMYLKEGMMRHMSDNQLAEQLAVTLGNRR